MLKTIIDRLVKPCLSAIGFNNMAWLFFGRDSFLKRSGWYRSAHSSESVDQNGQPIPWIAYSALSFLTLRLRSDMRVLEYGTGNSSLWFAAKVREIVSIEHDIEWAKKVEIKAPKNLRIAKIDLPFAVDYEPQGFAGIGEKNAYIDACRAVQGPWDVVFIDGIFRNACCREAVTILAESGTIIVDNSDVESFAAGRKCLLDSGFTELPFSGLGPIAARNTQTSIFYRQFNNLGV